MKYVGSKNRYAKYIIPLLDRTDQLVVEPFAGGLNLTQHIKGSRWANDINHYVINMFKAMLDGWQPPSVVTEEHYIAIRNNPENYPDELVGFVGVGCSYSGKWFGGYARGNNSKGLPQNYAAESKRNVLRQIKHLKGVKLTALDYQAMVIPKGSVVYLDPPYKGTTTPYLGGFDSNEFYSWVDVIAKDAHAVYLSEYNAPDSFELIWSKEVNNTLDKDTGAKKGQENLYRYKR